MNKEKLISEFVSKMMEVYVDRDTYSRGRIIDLAKNAFIDVINKNCNIPVVSQQRELLLAYIEFIEQPHHDGAYTHEEFIEMFLSQ